MSSLGGGVGGGSIITGNQQSSSYNQTQQSDKQPSSSSLQQQWDAVPRTNFKAEGDGEDAGEGVTSTSSFVSNHQPQSKYHHQQSSTFNKNHHNNLLLTNTNTNTHHTSSNSNNKVKSQHQQHEEEGNAFLNDQQPSHHHQQHLHQQRREHDHSHHQHLGTNHGQGGVSRKKKVTTTSSHQPQQQHHHPSLLNFNFRQRKGALDWRGLSNVEVDEVVRNTNVNALQRLIDTITFCDPESLLPPANSSSQSQTHQDEDFKVLLKTFKLSQLMLEYLLFSQGLLIGEVEGLRKEVGDARGREGMVEGVVGDYKKKLEEKTKELKVLKKTLFAYELLRNSTTTNSTSKGYGGGSGYSRRQQEVEGGQEGGGSSSSPYHRCTYCEKAFSTVGYLVSHEERRHGVSPPFPEREEIKVARQVPQQLQPPPPATSNKEVTKEVQEGGADSSKESKISKELQQVVESLMNQLDGRRKKVKERKRRREGGRDDDDEEEEDEEDEDEKSKEKLSKTLKQQLQQEKLRFNEELQSMKGTMYRELEEEREKLKQDREAFERIVTSNTMKMSHVGDLEEDEVSKVPSSRPTSRQNILNLIQSETLKQVDERVEKDIQKFWGNQEGHIKSLEQEVRSTREEMEHLKEERKVSEEDKGQQTSARGSIIGFQIQTTQKFVQQPPPAASVTVAAAPSSPVAPPNDSLYNTNPRMSRIALEKKEIWKKYNNILKTHNHTPIPHDKWATSKYHHPVGEMESQKEMLAIELNQFLAERGLTDVNVSKLSTDPSVKVIGGQLRDFIAAQRLESSKQDEMYDEMRLHLESQIESAAASAFNPDSVNPVDTPYSLPRRSSMRKSTSSPTKSVTHAQKVEKRVIETNTTKSKPETAHSSMSSNGGGSPTLRSLKLEIPPEVFAPSPTIANMNISPSIQSSSPTRFSIAESFKNAFNSLRGLRSPGGSSPTQMANPADRFESAMAAQTFKSVLTGGIKSPTQQPLVPQLTPQQQQMQQQQQFALQAARQVNERAALNNQQGGGLQQQLKRPTPPVPNADGKLKYLNLARSGGAPIDDDSASRGASSTDDEATSRDETSSILNITDISEITGSQSIPSPHRPAPAIPKSTPQRGKEASATSESEMSSFSVSEASEPELSKGGAGNSVRKSLQFVKEDENDFDVDTDSSIRATSAGVPVVEVASTPPQLPVRKAPSLPAAATLVKRTTTVSSKAESVKTIDGGEENDDDVLEFLDQIDASLEHSTMNRGSTVGGRGGGNIPTIDDIEDFDSY